MNRHQIYLHKKRIDTLFDLYSKLPDDDLLKSNWCKFMIIQICGFLESTLKSLLKDYATDSASPKVARYVETSLSDFRNPKVEKIFSLLSKFSVDWENDIRIQMTPEMNDSISSIVSLRHRVAHGGDIGATFTTVKGWYANTLGFLKIIDVQFGNQKNGDIF